MQRFPHLMFSRKLVVLPACILICAGVTAGMGTKREGILQTAVPMLKQAVMPPTQSNQGTLEERHQDGKMISNIEK